jgi:hypothetical protein
MPLIKWIINSMEWGDPWQSSGVSVLYHRVSPGSRHNFDWYFEGGSDVQVNSVEDVVDWLRSCEYESDMSLFNERDFWQHPRTFERLRRGDCEDFALWSWRKLTEIGVEAKVYVGRYAGSRTGHAWVVFTKDGLDYLLDGVIRDESIIRPLRECRNEFEPWFSISRSSGSVCHHGYMQWVKEKMNMPKDDQRQIVPEQRITRA